MSIKCFLKRNLLKKEFTYFKHRQNLSTRSTVLGIETSCDDTAVGVVTSDRKILAESKYNQWSKHSKLGMSKKDSQWSGGVVPDLAKKLHSVNLIHAVSDCIEKLPNGWSDIDAIALTTRPGLEICLWEGINFTRLLLNKYRLPLIPINHMEAHALTSRLFDPSLKYPFLTLLISGGHCLLVLAEEYDRFYQLGSSIDSSPGIYLDKVARSLGLFEIESANQDNGNDQTYGLSGGALVEKYAAKNGIVNEKRFNSFINSVKAYCGKNKDCDFSFSGFLSSQYRLISKEYESESNWNTIVLNGVEKKVLKKDIIIDMCHIAQHTVSFQLSNRLKRALSYLLEFRSINLTGVVVSGGVASNLFIRHELNQVVGRFGLRASYPPVKYCTDNGVMIAWNGCEKLVSQSTEIVYASGQDENFFENDLKPRGKCPFGVDISKEIKILEIKIKRAQ